MGKQNCHRLKFLLAVPLQPIYFFKQDSNNNKFKPHSKLGILEMMLQSHHMPVGSKTSLPWDAWRVLKKRKGSVNHH